MLDTLSFRIYTDYPGATPDKVEKLVHDLITYTRSNLMPIDISNSPVVTVGVHRDTGREHIHAQLQYQSPLWKDRGKGSSAHRKAWFVANKLDLPSGQNVTCTYGLAKNEDEANDHLSYAFKEGIVFPHAGNSQLGTRLEFLVARGQGIYEAEKRARQQKLARENKAKNIVSQLLELTIRAQMDHHNVLMDAKDLRFRVLREFYDQFTTPLDYPNSNDVKNAWQKVAVFTRVVQCDHFM